MKTCRKGIHSYSKTLKCCPDCHKIAMNKWKENNKNYVKVYDKNYYEAHKEQHKINTKIYREVNKEILKANKNIWIKVNKKKVLAKQKAWTKNNPHKVNAIRVKYRLAKLYRTPKWLTKNNWIEINWAYQIAHEKTIRTNIRHEVDHIIPLQGENVSGLHVPWNLQILTKSENSSKRNLYNI